MLEKFGIGIFFAAATALITFAIIGLAMFMERLYKKNKN
jgi:hypothetical protein